MARLARVIAVGVPHHVTQRGNAWRFILQDESDRKVYVASRHKGKTSATSICCGRVRTFTA